MKWKKNQRKRQVELLRNTVQSKTKNIANYYIGHLVLVKILLLLSFWKFVGIWLIYNVVLVLGIQQSDSVIYWHISIFFRFFSHIGYYRILSWVPCGIAGPCAIVGPCWLSILYIVMYSIYINPKLLIYLSPTPLLLG